MTTEDDFQATLDADPTDWHCRLLFADWLQELDDPRAEGMRMLGLLRKWPDNGRKRSACAVWDWYKYSDIEFVPRYALLGEQWGRYCYISYPTRRKAEDAACRAWLKLTDEQRAEIRERAFQHQEHTPA